MFNGVAAYSFFQQCEEAVYNAAQSAKNTIYFYTPNIIKDNITLVLSIFGDSTMTVPLQAGVFSLAINKLAGNDEYSDGTGEDEFIYWACFLSVLLLCYPGQALIAYKKNRQIVGEDTGIKKALKNTAVATVSLTCGASGYIFLEKVTPKGNAAPFVYGVFIFVLNGVFRQIFFNSSDAYNTPRAFKSSLSKSSAKAMCSLFSIVYALSSSTPFAAAKFSRCSPDSECAGLLLMIATMTAGEYLRMHSGLLNYMRLLDDNEIKFNAPQKAICISSAAIRTLLTMSSISDYPAAVKLPVYAALTPGVGFFQLSACMPPEKYEVEANEIEMMGVDDESPEVAAVI